MVDDEMTLKFEHLVEMLERMPVKTWVPPLEEEIEKELERTIYVWKG